ncbi:CDK5 regulatory subunit-associated protein 2 isoform X2 [Camponotus floridanus]|uniref:CDK5 regulatory subunit-associated protein 2 isoform X2 n=1 Tax=Camponotus floridanus TaxID=104421 RepID=UPI000DC6697A|nr:CDK5 regulatory subunit-associated protein 2 isoform X2 [Camponotus floridanus]
MADFEETMMSSFARTMELEITNNMPLQDITMSQTMPLTNGGNTRAYGENIPEDSATMARSGGSGGGGTGGGSSGGVSYGRTMKEYEDELSSLKKENFQLKLRIYFLEEKNPTRSGISSSDEDIIKTNVELKDELEKLRKELMEKQVLLNQAATAFKLYEEQKASTREQYQQLLETEREKVAKLEREAEQREGDLDASTYYKETFGITPEQALKNAEKLRQMEELVASLEAEVKQTTVTLEEERYWAEELENERDQFREQLDMQTQLREKQDCDRVQSIEKLREEVKELKEELLKKDSVAQQCKDDLSERDRLLKQKNSLLEEKNRMYEEIKQVSEKRKKQIIQLRTSVKTRDDALAEINNKHRTLLSQCENYGKRSPPNSPSAVTPLGTIDLPLFVGQNITKYNAYDHESNTKENTASLNSSLGGDGNEIRQLIKELEERDNELKRQEETRKQMILKLCNAQKQMEISEQKLKKLEGEYEKAIRAIQGFVEREQQIQDIYSRKEQRILELETELRKRRNSHDPVSLKDLDVKNTSNSENDSSKQQRFEEMESKINDLRDQIETIKAEKSLLEKQEEQTQIQFEELEERFQDKVQRIEILETEKQIITKELKDKIAELDKLKHVEMNSVNEVTTTDCHNDTPRRDELLEQLDQRNVEIEEKNRKIEQLTKELQMTTQNLQKLVNTELWSKNKEIAKLHNHMTASYGHDRSRNKSETVQEVDNSQLTNLIRELNEIGIKVNIADETVQLNYINGNETVNIKTLGEYVQRLSSQRNDLEKEVDYLKWLKLVAKPDIAAEIDGCGNETERAKKYCELLRTHLKDLVKFMKEMLQSADRADTIGNEHKKIVLDVLLSSKILSNDFVRALEGMTVQDNVAANDRTDGSVRRSRSENIAETAKNQASQSDSETFSEPDRTVSMARIGLQEMQYKNPSRSRFTKYTKACSDSEDSADYVPYYKTYQNDLNDLDTSYQIQELKETNNMLYSELSALRNDLVTKVSSDCAIDEKLTLFITKLEKSQKFCEKLQASLEKRIHEFHVLRKESKQNSFRKTQMEKKINDVEQMANEMTKQKAEFLQYKENEKKNTETLLILNKENESMRVGIKRLEEENETAKTTISTLRKDLDHLTLSHSQILVENTKLTNDKLRLEQEIRKMENRYDVTVRSLHDKFSKEIFDLNQINDSHQARVQELEATNKEFRRHMAVCEASDSAPSSSGVSSIPTDTTLKQTCDILHKYQSYNNLQHWQSTNYYTLGGRSKSSCSPDLGIESDAAVTTIRPLKDTLKITESMTNLLSDEDSGNGNHRARDTNSESPLPIEGLDEVETLKQENEALKRKLMKTRRALEDTFEHLSTSNKNKKNVEKAIIKQLMITRNVLKKTRTFDEPSDN